MRTRLEVWNAGELPPPLRPEDLRGPHPSVLRNPLLARAFYFAGLIERWGTGTTRIIELCRQQGLPEPEFQNQQGGFLVAFAKDPYTPERLRKLGLSERQIQIVHALRSIGSVSLGKLHRLFPNVSAKTVQRDLQVLVKRGLVKAEGEKKRGGAMSWLDNGHLSVISDIFETCISHLLFPCIAERKAYG